MMRNKIKPITIHVLPVSAIKPDLLDIDLQNVALIVCSEDSNRFLNVFTHKLITPFADTNEKRVANSITPTQANEIIGFLKSLPTEVTDLYICCSEGYSRSPAAAAVVLRMSARKDIAIRNNPYYSPNTLVYQTICHGAGMFAPTWYVWILKIKNSFKYRMSKARGNAGNYERWQIIE